MKILHREEMQQADRHTIEHVGIPGYALMECAAQAMLEETEKVNTALLAFLKD